jgi:hypothetical protein
MSWRRSADAVERVAEEIGAAARLVATAGLSAVSALPQFEQNLAPARFAAPQAGQRTGSAAPHASQNLLLSGVSEWQLGHSMSAP